MEETLQTEIDITLSMLADIASSETGNVRSNPLDDLFVTLRQSEDTSQTAETEDLIWALWCSHEDEQARSDLNHAIGAIARGELDDAETILDALIERWPGWAEAWNKRATLYFLQERYVDSVRDIQRTLELEPRHFGALSGLGQICVKNGDEHAALIAFECALLANPGLAGIREAAERLRSRVKRVLH